MTHYLILADFGKLGRSYIERDPVDTGWVATIRDLAAGQVDNPLQVIEFDLARGTCRDATQDAREAVFIARRGECPAGCGLRTFLDGR